MRIKMSKAGKLLCVGRGRLGDQTMKESKERYDALSVAVVVLVWMAFVEAVA